MAYLTVCFTVVCPWEFIFFGLGTLPSKCLWTQALSSVNYVSILISFCKFNSYTGLKLIQDSLICSLKILWSNAVAFRDVMGEEFYMWALEIYDSAHQSVKRKTKKSLDKHHLHGKHWITSGRCTFQSCFWWCWK